jgi:hypothetical protein
MNALKIGFIVLLSAAAQFPLPGPTPTPPPVLVVVAKLTRIASGAGCGYFSMGVVAEYTDIQVIVGKYSKDKVYVVHGCPELSRSEFSASAGSLETLDIGAYHHLELLSNNFYGLELIYDDHIKPRFARLFYVLRADPGERQQRDQVPQSGQVPVPARGSANIGVSAAWLGWPQDSRLWRRGRSRFSSMSASAQPRSLRPPNTGPQPDGTAGAAPHG